MRDFPGFQLAGDSAGAGWFVSAWLCWAWLVASFHPGYGFCFDRSAATQFDLDDMLLTVINQGNAGVGAVAAVDRYPRYLR